MGKIPQRAFNSPRVLLQPVACWANLTRWLSFQFSSSLIATLYTLIPHNCVCGVVLSILLESYCNIRWRARRSTQGRFFQFSSSLIATLSTPRAGREALSLSILLESYCNLDVPVHFQYELIAFNSPRVLLQLLTYSEKLVYSLSFQFSSSLIAT